MTRDAGRVKRKPEPATVNVQPAIILRHDVDARPENSLAFAQIQQSMGITGTYYFRSVPQSFDESIIREIASLGHEIGYHYETMDTCRGDVDRAYDAFCRNLEKFRKVVPIETICLHGSPLSRYDNRDIWKKYDYRKLGIIAEPYFDLDFGNTAYYTDTGRRWNGAKVSIRDQGTNFATTDNRQPITDNRKLSTINIFVSIRPTHLDHCWLTA